VAGNVVADVRAGVPWRVPVIFGNWATPADYARAGRELGERIGAETVIAPPEIGTLATSADARSSTRLPTVVASCR
jgi:hypothetical protein